MVAISFKARFAPAILAGRKAQTCRRIRKGKPIVVGDRLQIFTGLRTPNCQRLGDAVCDRVLPVALNLDPKVATVWLDGHYMGVHQFAYLDGFSSFEAMREFWAVEHGTDRWEGVMIGWTDFRPAEGGRRAPL